MNQFEATLIDYRGCLEQFAGPVIDPSIGQWIIFDGEDHSGRYVVLGQIVEISDDDVVMEGCRKVYLAGNNVLCSGRERVPRTYLNVSVLQHIANWIEQSEKMVTQMEKAAGQ